MNKKDIKLLKFIYERLNSVYGESKNIDYMINFGILLGKLTEDKTGTTPDKKERIEPKVIKTENYLDGSITYDIEKPLRDQRKESLESYKGINAINPIDNIQPPPECKPPRQTPNCVKCRWLLSELDDDGLTQIPINYSCLAMGGLGAEICWNTDECKQLYEVSE